MAAVIAARFDSFANANSAAHALFAYGVPPDSVSVFFAPDQSAPADKTGDLDRDPQTFSGRFYAQINVATLAMLGALLGAAAIFVLDGPAWAVAGAAAAGSFVASWTGAVWLARKTSLQRDEQQRRHALLTARVPLVQEQDVIELLLDAGSEKVERARGRWLHGQWVDAEPSGRSSGGSQRRSGGGSPARGQGQPMRDGRPGLERGLL